jgi:glycosyltransferase involved in cell wall biosynthesis
MMNIALIHEWLATFAGSERVVEQMLGVFPEAELFALVDFLPADERQWLGDRPVQTSFLQRMPFARRRFRGYLPLMPLAIEQFDLSKYDVVVSSNHAVAKGVVTRADQLHVSYVHTPIRYAWDLQHQYLRESRLTSGLRSAAVRLLLHYLRLWDRAAADRVDVFVANSHYVAQRIWKTYRRECHVVYPPVDVDQYEFREDKEDFYLAASRMVPYKKVDLIVEAFNRMPHKRLIVIGTGPEYKKVAARAGPNVTLLGYQSFEVLRDHMQRARAFVFAADEDFGIMPVEAQACGTPVIAFGRGGATETVCEGETGLFFQQQSAESIVAAVEAFESHRHEFEPELIRANAKRFGSERFQQEFSELVENEWESFGHRLRRGDNSREVAGMPYEPVRVTAR